MDRPDNRQLDIYKRMSPSDKFALVEKLYWDARKLRESVVQAQNPELTSAEVKEKVKREFLLARTD